MWDECFGDGPPRRANHPSRITHNRVGRIRESIVTARWAIGLSPRLFGLTRWPGACGRRAALCAAGTLARVRRRGPVAQWSELAAHNRLVGGSSPPGPTTHSLTTDLHQACPRKTPFVESDGARWCVSRVSIAPGSALGAELGRPSPLNADPFPVRQAPYLRDVVRTEWRRLGMAVSAEGEPFPGTLRGGVLEPPFEQS
jgi:hypothetical protein